MTFNNLVFAMSVIRELYKDELDIKYGDSEFTIAFEHAIFYTDGETFTYHADNTAPIIIKTVNGLDDVYQFLLIKLVERYGYSYHSDRLLKFGEIGGEMQDTVQRLAAQYKFSVMELFNDITTRVGRPKDIALEFQRRVPERQQKFPAHVIKEIRSMNNKSILANIKVDVAHQLELDKQK